MEQSRQAPAIDLIVVPNGPDMNRVAEFAANDYRLAGAPVIVSAKAGDVANLRLVLSEKRGFGVIQDGADDGAINTAVSQARADVGSVPLDADKATAFALEGLKLLGNLSADHHSIFTVGEAVPTLSDALKDKRPEIATAAANVLGNINSPEGERALATAALSDVDAALRIIYFDALAESAKRSGNALDGSMVNALIKVVGSADTDPKLRMAAARALGALNVPSNQASYLILQQSK